MNWTLICRGNAGLCFPDLYLPTLPLFSNKLDSSLVRINPALLLLNIMSHLGEAPSDICRFLELSFAATNYRPSTEKHSPMRKPGWPPVFMPMLVRISPGDKILSGTEILMKQTTKAQGMTLDNSTNADAEKETSTGWQTKRWPNASRHEYQTNYSGNQTTKLTAKTANRSSSNDKTTLASIRIAIE